MKIKAVIYLLLIIPALIVLGVIAAVDLRRIVAVTTEDLENLHGGDPFAKQRVIVDGHDADGRHGEACGRMGARVSPIPVTLRM